MAHFVKSSTGRPQADPPSIHGTTVSLTEGQRSLFGIYGDVGLEITFDPPNAATVQWENESMGHHWFRLTPRVAGVITVNAVLRAQNATWSTFTLSTAAAAGHELPIVERAPTMTPQEMVNRYRNLRVFRSNAVGDAIVMGTESIPFSLNNYLCNNPAFGGAAEALRLKDQLLNISWGHGHGTNLRTLFGISGTELVTVFTGKASPALMEKVLGYVDFVIRFRPAALRGAFPNLVEQGIGMMASAPQGTAPLIGLDCNGFTGNWQKAAGYPGVDGNSYIPAWPCRGRRMTLAAIHSYDVAPFHNGQHIMVLHNVYERDGKKVADIAQSTGRKGATGGPQFSQGHELRTTGVAGVFRIMPGVGFNPVVFGGNGVECKIVATGFAPPAPR